MTNGPSYPLFDERSLDAAQKGDPAALERLFHHYDPLIRSIPAWSKWSFPPTLQEDLCQNIRLQLQKVLSQFRGGKSLEFFIKSICIHRCIDEVRCQIKLRKLMTPLMFDRGNGAEYHAEVAAKASGDVDPATLVDLGERSAALRRILDSIDEPCRTVIGMFYFEGLSYKEMASRLDISIITVGTRLSKCLNKLRIVLSQDKMFKEPGRCERGATVPEKES